MQLKIFDISIVKGWFGSLGDFMKVAVKPGAGAPSDDPAVLTKWLVSGMWVLIISHVVNIGYYAMMPGGNVVSGVINAAYNAAYAFVLTWIIWYAFVKREPSCCFVCIFCIEDFQPMHLIYGILLVISGVLQALGAVNAILANLAYITEIYAILNAVYCVFILLYAITMLGSGLCLIKLGGKKAGVDIPAAEVGKESA